MNEEVDTEYRDPGLWIDAYRDTIREQQESIELLQRTLEVHRPELGQVHKLPDGSCLWRMSLEDFEEITG